MRQQQERDKAQLVAQLKLEVDKLERRVDQQTRLTAVDNQRPQAGQPMQQTESDGRTRQPRDLQAEAQTTSLSSSQVKQLTFDLRRENINPSVTLFLGAIKAQNPLAYKLAYAQGQEFVQLVNTNEHAPTALAWLANALLQCMSKTCPYATAFRSRLLREDQAVLHDGRRLLNALYEASRLPLGPESVHAHEDFQARTFFSIRQSKVEFVNALEQLHREYALLPAAYKPGEYHLHTVLLDKAPPEIKDRVDQLRERLVEAQLAVKDVTPGGPAAAAPWTIQRLADLIQTRIVQYQRDNHIGSDDANVAERNQGRQNLVCNYCGDTGHYCSQCPNVCSRCSINCCPGNYRNGRCVVMGNGPRPSASDAYAQRSRSCSLCSGRS